MNNLEKIADELFNSMYDAEDGLGKYPMCYDTANQCSIIAVNRTIKVLEELKKQFIKINYKSTYLIIILHEQLELKKILEGRL